MGEGTDEVEELGVDDGGVMSLEPPRKQGRTALMLTGRHSLQGTRDAWLGEGHDDGGAFAVVAGGASSSFPQPRQPL